MSITTLLETGTIRIEHDLDVALHPDTNVPTRISTRPYRYRYRHPDGMLPYEDAWNYAHYKYRAERDKQARHAIDRGYLIQVWDFPDQPNKTPTLKNNDAIARAHQRRIGGWCYSITAKRYFRKTDDGWR